MIGELHTTIKLTGAHGSKIVTINAPGAVFLNVSLQGLQEKYPHDPIRFVGHTVGTVQLYTKFGQGNPPDFGFDPIHPAIISSWIKEHEGKSPTLEEPFGEQDETNAPVAINRALSRSFSACRFLLEYEQEINLTSVILDAEWGTEDDLGPIGISTGSF